MSFYSYKNAAPINSPGEISGSALDGLNERICIQVQRVYDSCLQQEQLDNVDVTLISYGLIPGGGCGSGSSWMDRKQAAEITVSVAVIHLSTLPPVRSARCAITG